MFKTGFVALVAAAALAPSFAQADEFERGMNTMWEVLWHQSGTATRLVRWDQDLKVRVFGVNAGLHKQHTLKALRDVATEAGLKVIDVTDAADAAEQANVNIEITPDTALSDGQPCETRLQFKSEARIDAVTVQMRNRDAWRCAFHESMHVMGVRGHPEGDTVLSYFPKKVDGLLPLDKAMLHAWYSPRARGGMTPFELMPILADELAAVMPHKQKAALSRDRFMSKTVEQMHAFANGTGDVPTIVKRCGKSSETGIRFGRMEMSYFLGIAYQEGVSVRPDPALASLWLERAAKLGSRSAQARLGSATLAGNS